MGIFLNLLYSHNKQRNFRSHFYSQVHLSYSWKFLDKNLFWIRIKPDNFKVYYHCSKVDASPSLDSTLQFLTSEPGIVPVGNIRSNFSCQRSTSLDLKEFTIGIQSKCSRITQCGWQTLSL